MKEETAGEISRKNFFMKIALALGSVTALIIAIPVVGALLAPLLEGKEDEWRKVGLVSDFAAGTTKLVSFINSDPKPYAGVTARSAAWLRKDSDNKFTAFSVNCTHLGCPVRWEATAELFMCPCHGGVYYKDGTVASGPPPKELTQYPVRVFKSEVQIKTEPLPLTKISD